VSAAKKGLGRGFESLIPIDLIDDSFDPTATEDQQVSELRHIPIGEIRADPDQPRRTFDEEALAELTESIREHGVLQPIIVTRSGEGYQIVAGERRYRASKRAGLATVPAIVRSMSDQKKLELSLIENLQRQDLNAIETATAYVKLRDQFNLTNEEVGKRVNKSSSAVQNTARLLKLPKEVRTLVAEGKLTEGQVRPLISWDEAFVMEIIPRILAEDWSARKVEQYVVNAKNDRARSTQEPEAAPAEARHEARVDSLKARLATDVAIRVNSKGAGRIIINFKDDADLERLQKLLSE
jgi:ParB family chromosome partitioning protein